VPFTHLQAILNREVRGFVADHVAWATLLLIVAGLFAVVAR
jgi:hypothetical protein